MTLDDIKWEGSSLPQDTRSAPALRLPACTSPRWPGFYRQPIENDIIDGTEWIDSLWKILHRANPVKNSHRTSRCFDSTSRNVSKVIFVPFMIRSRIETKTLYTIYDILECRGYIESVCPGLINDILQEIKDKNSDTVEFSADLRHRCKIAGPELEDKMSMLQAVVTRQHRDFNPKNFVKTMDYIYYGSLVILFLVLIRFWLWQPPKFGFHAWLLSVQFTTSITSDAHSRAHDIGPEFDDLNTNTFQLIWAVRDMAGLLTLIAESEGSPFPDVLQAERFLQAFRASFLGGRKELSSLRSWLQERHCWTDKNFGAHHWNDHGKNLLRTRYTTYQAPSAQRVLPCISPFSSMAATRIYTKVFGAISRSDNEKLQTDSARQNGYRRLATAKPEAGAIAPIPVSIASGDDLSTANSSYSRTITQDTKDST